MEEEGSRYRVWAILCPFTKTGYPVTGTSVRSVVIMTGSTWKKICEDVPQLQRTMFEVGTCTED